MTFSFCLVAGAIWTEGTCVLERKTAATAELRVTGVYFLMRRITVITDKSIIAKRKQQWKQEHVIPLTKNAPTHQNCHSLSCAFNR